jgi:hypothetical protein
MRAESKAGGAVKRHLPLVTQLACVATVATIMLPLGPMIFPYVDGVVGGLTFEAAEAVVTAGLGFGLYALLFG